VLFSCPFSRAGLVGRAVLSVILRHASRRAPISNVADTRMGDRFGVRFAWRAATPARRRRLAAAPAGAA